MALSVVQALDGCALCSLYSACFVCSLCVVGKSNAVDTLHARTTETTRLAKVEFQDIQSPYSQLLVIVIHGLRRLITDRLRLL